MIGYHGTSKKSANIILRSEFQVSDGRDDHWLGTGIYFFQNICDADSWSKQKFKPAIIECNLEYEECKFLDLDNPDMLSKTMSIWTDIESEYRANNISLSFKSDKHAMCYILNVYKKMNGIELIKYTFPNMRTARKNKYIFLNKGYQYNEVQLCCTNNETIKSKRLVRMEGS